MYYFPPIFPNCFIVCLPYVHMYSLKLRKFKHSMPLVDYILSKCNSAGSKSQLFVLAGNVALDLL